MNERIDIRRTQAAEVPKISTWPDALRFRIQEVPAFHDHINARVSSVTSAYERGLYSSKDRLSQTAELFEAWGNLSILNRDAAQALFSQPDVHKRNMCLTLRNNQLQLLRGIEEWDRMDLMNLISVAWGISHISGFRGKELTDFARDKLYLNYIPELLVQGTETRQILKLADIGLIHHNIEHNNDWIQMRNRWYSQYIQQFDPSITDLLDFATLCALIDPDWFQREGIKMLTPAFLEKCSRFMEGMSKLVVSNPDSLDTRDTLHLQAALERIRPFFEPAATSQTLDPSLPVQRSY